MMDLTPRMARLMLVTCDVLAVTGGLSIVVGAVALYFAWPNMYKGGYALWGAPFWCGFVAIACGITGIVVTPKAKDIQAGTKKASRGPYMILWFSLLIAACAGVANSVIADLTIYGCLIPKAATLSPWCFPNFMPNIVLNSLHALIGLIVLIDAGLANIVVSMVVVESFFSGRKRADEIYEPLPGGNWSRVIGQLLVKLRGKRNTSS